jgi:Fe-coproporphyrin III synthase
MPARGAAQRIVHIHPGLACNLCCGHCYSSSGPAAKTSLQTEIVLNVITDAARFGYAVASFSGGEPFVQSGLPKMLHHARRHGMHTAIVSNGTLLTLEVLSTVVGNLDLLAISLDGPPDLHNRMRGSSTSFSRMLAGVENVRQMEINFGFVFTLTNANWEHLVWAGEFAVEHGAKLLQIHPLENTGRARGSLQNLCPSPENLSKAYLLASAIQGRHGKQLRVQLDVFCRDCIFENLSSIYVDDARLELGSDPLSSFLSLIIVEADGNVVPLCYGFSRNYRICDLKEERFADAFPVYMSQRYHLLEHLCRGVYREKILPMDSPLFSWYELVTEASYSYEQKALPAVRTSDQR